MRKTDLIGGVSALKTLDKAVSLIASTLGGYFQIFVVLKLTSLIAWSWFWVLSPLILAFIAGATIGIIKWKIMKDLVASIK